MRPIRARVRGEHFEVVEDGVDPRRVWAAGENRLVEIIRDQTTVPYVESTGQFGLILVYKRACLTPTNDKDYFEFKKGIKPKDAIVAGIRFPNA